MRFGCENCEQLFPFVPSSLLHRFINFYHNAVFVHFHLNFTNNCNVYVRSFRKSDFVGPKFFKHVNLGIFIFIYIYICIDKWIFLQHFFHFLKKSLRMSLRHHRELDFCVKSYASEVIKLLLSTCW